MDRREFLKRAGIGSIGLGTLAVTPAALAGFRKGDGHQHFSLVALSSTSASEATNHVMILEGAGSFKAKTGHVNRTGGGNFVHVEDFPSPGSGPLASGKWNPTSFVSYDAGPPFGDYGRIRASILVVKVVLRPDAGGSLAGTLQIACNVGFADIQTGEPEGFKLSVPGFNFDTPFLGLTHISIPEGASSV
ncbi:MAG: twin-arginine translocation signal domain-containing protein [Actinomycetota bacterium]